MNNKIKWALISIAMCSAGTVMAAGAHELLGDAETMSKMGVLGVMGVMVTGLVVAVAALCKFILSVILPIKDHMIKSTDVLQRVADKMDKVHDDVIRGK